MNMFHWESSWIIELECVLHQICFTKLNNILSSIPPPARILVLWYHLNYDSDWTQFRSDAKIRFFYMKYLPSIWIFRYRNQLGKYRHGIHLGIYLVIHRLGKYQFSVSHLFIETNCTDTIYSCISYNIVDSERKHFRIFECAYFSPMLSVYLIILYKQYGC